MYIFDTFNVLFWETFISKNNLSMYVDRNGEKNLGTYSDVCFSYWERKPHFDYNNNQYLLVT